MKELFRVLISRIKTRNIDLLPLDGYVVGFEDSFDSFRNLRSDAVT